MNYIQSDAWAKLMNKVLNSNYTSEQKVNIIELIMQCPEYIEFDNNLTEVQISSR